MDEQDHELHDALPIYFEAKARMFAKDPSFRLIDVGGLKCLHNHPGWPEVDSLYAVDSEVSSDEVIATIHAYRPHPAHMLTIFTDSPESARTVYENRGYRSLPNSQPFLSKSLASLQTGNSASDSPTVRRAETEDDVRFLNMFGKVMNPDHRMDPLYRYYYVNLYGKPVCWGRCVVLEEAIYIAGLETTPEYRRRGLAAVLMNRMHGDAASSGARQSVLCSTTMAFSVYKKLGYRLLAYMQAFAPRLTDAD